MSLEVSSQYDSLEGRNLIKYNNEVDISSLQEPSLIKQHRENEKSLKESLAYSLGVDSEKPKSIIQSAIEETLANSDNSVRTLKTEGDSAFSSTQRWEQEIRTNRWRFIDSLKSLLLLAGGSREVPEEVINASISNPPPAQEIQIDSLPLEIQEHFLGKEGPYTRISHPFVEYPVTEEILCKLVSIATEEIEKNGYKNFFYPVSVYQSLPDSFPLDTAELELITLEGKQVASIMADDLGNMLSQATSEGFHPVLRSAFRSVQTQKSVFRNNGKNFRASAPPGNSEHHLGLAVDILENGDGWNDSRKNWDGGIYKWFRENCWRFGFVISYPTGDDIQTSKEGSGYESGEPWHLRYVGPRMAEFMYNDLKYLDLDSPYTVNNIMSLIWEESYRSPITRD